MEGLSFLLSYFLTAMLFGVMLMQQLVIYPLLKALEGEAYDKLQKTFLDFNKKYIIPSMCIEMFMDFELIYVKIYPDPQQFLIRLFLIFLIWIVTFVVVSPVYKKLEIEKNDKLLKELMLIGWIRTGLWLSRILIHAVC